MRVLLELLRIICIMIVIGGILGKCMDYVYLKIGTNTEKYGWMGSVAILILIFVLTTRSEFLIQRIHRVS